MPAPKFKKNKVVQTIDLEKEFGVSFKGRRGLREAIGEAILEKIRARTAEGDGMKFSGRGASPVDLNKKKYSKAYTKSDEFKAFGKSKTPVNMNLSGTMMDTMDIVKQTGDSITIGWTEKEENNKAFNHSTGDTVPERPFFGISNKELKAMKKEFKSELKDAVADNSTVGFEQTVTGFIDKLKG